MTLKQYGAGPMRYGPSQSIYDSTGTEADSGALEGEESREMREAEAEMRRMVLLRNPPVLIIGGTGRTRI